LIQQIIEIRLMAKTLAVFLPAFCISLALAGALALRRCMCAGEAGRRDVSSLVYFGIGRVILQSEFLSFLLLSRRSSFSQNAAHSKDSPLS
jgi:hypothetical protein